MITMSGDATLCDISMGMTSQGTAHLTVKVAAPCFWQPDGVRILLVWTGDRAACFYADYEHQLKQGRDLWFEAQNPRPLMSGGEMCLMASALDIQIANPAAKSVTKMGAHYTPRPLVKSRWVSLEGVAT